MRTTTCALLVLATLCGLLVPALAAEPPQNIVLIGWDGAQRNHVKECLGRGELPTIQRLSAEGALVAIDTPRITDTKSGWAQILTGYEPEVTGVFSNGRYQPIPRGYSIFERLEQHFGADNIVTLAAIGKSGHVDAEPERRIPLDEAPAGQQPAVRQAPAAPGDQLGVPAPAVRPRLARQAARQANRPQEGTIITEGGKRYRLIPGKPYAYTKEGMDLFLNGLGANDNVGAKALELLQEHKDQRFFFFVHFADVDQRGHGFGENSKEYNDALISCDTWTGKIVDKLKELGLYQRTLIYVTADHGFDEAGKGHSDAPYVFLATNDPQVQRRGERVDITPTILDRFGLDLGKINPALDGHSLARPYQPPLW